MLVRAPILISPWSARMTTPNQMLASSPTSTSPINVALGAINAEGAIRGRFPPYSISIQGRLGAASSGAYRRFDTCGRIRQLAQADADRVVDCVPDCGRRR